VNGGNDKGFWWSAGQLENPIARAQQNRIIREAKGPGRPGHGNRFINRSSVRAVIVANLPNYHLATKRRQLGNNFQGRLIVTAHPDNYFHLGAVLYCFPD
jgi:hypothetical protein